jgi:hypothetical protein
MRARGLPQAHAAGTGRAGRATVTPTPPVDFSLGTLTVCPLTLAAVGGVRSSADAPTHVLQLAAPMAPAATRSLRQIGDYIPEATG